MLEKRKVWIDGELRPFNKAQVHIMSHSFCRGSAVFEVMSLHDTVNGPAVFRLGEHIDRLLRSARAVHMKLPWSKKAIGEAVFETVKKNKVKAGMVKLMCYYGGVEFEVVPRIPKVSMAVVVVDIMEDLDAERFKKAARQPAKACVSEWRKIDPRTIPVECKSSASYLGGMVAKMEAMKAGYNTPILMDVKGYLAEGPTETLFMVKNRVVKTPSLGNVLSGITRKTVLEIADDIGIKTVEKKIRPKELYEADEVFFTSSIAKIWPVRSVDKTKYNAPGEVTRLIDKVFDKIITGKVKSYGKWLDTVK